MSRTVRTKRIKPSVKEDLKPGDKLDKKHQRAIVRDGEAIKEIRDEQDELTGAPSEKRDIKHKSIKQYRDTKKKQEKDALRSSGEMDTMTMSRLIANRAILTVISAVVEKHPDWRFHQILQNINIEHPSRDDWYVEPCDTLKEALEAFADLNAKEK